MTVPPAAADRPPRPTAEREAPRPARPAKANSTGRALLWAVAAAVVAFLIGFGWQYSRARSADARAAYASRALAAARLEATLGGAVIDAQQGHYEISRQRTSNFFTGVQRRLAPTLPTDPAAQARQLLNERDAIITGLARNDPASASVLAELLTRYREIVSRGGLDSAVALPTDAAAPATTAPAAP